MANDLAIGTIRLALGLQDLRARVATDNIANLNRAGAQAQRVGGDAAAFLAGIPDQPESAALLRAVEAAADAARSTPLDASAATTADHEVADMVEASAAYQALTEVLGREFALMRLSITGRS